MPLADQLRQLERERDDLLDRMDSTVMRAENENRGFTPQEWEDHKLVKAQLDGLIARHKIVAGQLDQQKLRAAALSGHSALPDCSFDALSGDGAIAEVILNAPGGLREAIRRSGLVTAIAQSGGHGFANWGASGPRSRRSSKVGPPLAESGRA